MKVFMLGWEFPPHISGGLGTACQGLTEGLARQGVDVDFVVPHLYGGEPAGHMRIFGADEFAAPAPPPAAAATPAAVPPPAPRTAPAYQPHLAAAIDHLQHLLGTPEAQHAGTLRTASVPSLLHPYLTAEHYDMLVAELLKPGVRRALRLAAASRAGVPLAGEAGDAAATADDEGLAALPPSLQQLLRDMPASRPGGHYGANLFAETARYARSALELAEKSTFDVIHAHDWMTYPAALLVQAATAKRLVLHVHSIEFDRSGENGDRRILEIERAGLHAADHVIAVSHYTRGLVHERYGIPLEKIDVVHNGVYPRAQHTPARQAHKWHAKVVLFLGRVTFQKGPDYFVEAAAKVVPHMPDVTFVMAGTGDMLPRMIERVADLGIERNFHFTGFLRGAELETMFSVADLYVMPSVSEPFGISPLEALSYDVPVIISRQSGVAEVLQHALKTDFWDVDRLAELILAALRYPELREEINVQAREELRRLRWDAAAQKTARVYERLAVPSNRR
jgi:glycosyltransferase involved in cell wall biosynthesis